MGTHQQMQRKFKLKKLRSKLHAAKATDFAVTKVAGWEWEQPATQLELTQQAATAIQQLNWLRFGCHVDRSQAPQLQRGVVAGA